MKASKEVVDIKGQQIKAIAMKGQQIKAEKDNLHLFLQFQQSRKRRAICVPYFGFNKVERRASYVPFVEGQVASLSSELEEKGNLCPLLRLSPFLLGTNFADCGEKKQQNRSVS